MRKATVFSLVIVLLAFGFGAYLFRRMPLIMATHWGISGMVNGYSPRPVGVFSIPSIMALIWIIFQVAPKIDPKKKNFRAFQPAYDRFIILLFMFLEYLYLVTLAWNLGHRFDFLRLVLPAFAVIYYAMGNLVEEAEPNWLVGVRSPWTLSSPTVWKKTNRVAGTLFKWSAAVALLTIPFPAYGLYLVLAPVIATSLITIAYSYILYRREEPDRNGA